MAKGKRMLLRVLKSVASLRLTVLLLSLSLLLVFFGTLAQVELGISTATVQFFRSWFVYWQPETLYDSLPAFLSSIPIRPPVILPGAWALGTLLLLNLSAAFVTRFRFKWSKLGLLLSHAGIIVLLVGELLSGVFQVETYLQLDEGETRNYTISRSEPELVVKHIGEGNEHTVYAFDDALLEENQTLSHDALPFRLKLTEHYPNIRLSTEAESSEWKPVDASLGIGANVFYRTLPPETEMNAYDQPMVVADIRTEGGSLGTLLLSTILIAPQQMTIDGESYELSLRWRRFTFPFSFTLIDFRHDKYPGTEKPRNFSSRLQFVDPERKEDREVLIRMNEPFRYAGLSFYQHSFDNADTTTILQVVKNPARWLPYMACAMVFFGLSVHFVYRLNQRRSQRKQSETVSVSEAIPLWKRLLIPGSVLLLLPVVVITALMDNKQHAFDTDTFGKLPVLRNGRIQPLDTLARNSLIILSSKSYIKTEQGKISAIDWLTELSAQPELAAERQVFLLHNKELKGELGLDVEQKLFSYDELTLKREVDGRSLHPIDIINEQAQAANNVEGKLRTQYQRDVLRLFNQLWLYRGLINSIRPEDTEDFPAELNHFEAILGSGTVAFMNQQAGVPFDREALQRLVEAVERYNRLQMIGYYYAVPPKDAEAPVDDWTKAGDALVLSVRTQTVEPTIKQYADVLHAYRYNDVDGFNDAVQELHGTITEQRPQDSKKAQYEQLYNKLSLFTLSQIGYVLALVLTLASYLLFTWPLQAVARTIVYTSAVLHTAGIVFRMFLDGRPPVTNLYSSAVFIGWGTVLLAMLLEVFTKRGIAMIGATLVGFSTLMIAHYLSLEGDTLEMMQAVLDSNFWLATHVLVITLGYSAMFVAGALAIVWLIMRLIRRAENTDDLKLFGGMIYGVICFSLLFSFTGTVLGGIWADQSWGRFWGWDPKENGALLIVIWTAMILHARLAGLIRARGMAVMAVFGNVITAWSWFGTNMLGIGLHSYGFTDAASIALYSFVLSQLVVMSLALIPVKPKQASLATS